MTLISSKSRSSLGLVLELFLGGLFLELLYLGGLFVVLLYLGGLSVEVLYLGEMLCEVLYLGEMLREVLREVLYLGWMLRESFLGGRGSSGGLFALGVFPVTGLRKGVCSKFSL